MPNIVFLGPAGATFSYEAYVAFANEFDFVPYPKEKNNVPHRGLFEKDPKYSLLPVGRNEEVLPALCHEDDWGVVAMETKVGGTISEPLESFRSLLDAAVGERIRVLTALKLPIHVALVVKRGTRKEFVKRVIAHPQALRACEGYIKMLGAETQSVGSNGTAVEFLEQSDGTIAALAPRAVVEKYRFLNILDERCEDAEAVTTFFLLTTNTMEAWIGKENRAFIVFRVPNKPDALISAVQIFQGSRMNMTYIHSLHAG